MEIEMKKFALVIVIAVAGLLAYNFATTGHLTLVPGGKQSAVETALSELDDELADLRQQTGQAYRTASLSGMDTTADVEAARRGVERLEKSLKELSQRLDSDRARKQARKLTSQIKSFKKELL